MSVFYKTNTNIACFTVKLVLPMGRPPCILCRKINMFAVTLNICQYLYSFKVGHIQLKWPHFWLYPVCICPFFLTLLTLFPLVYLSARGPQDCDRGGKTRGVGAQFVWEGRRSHHGRDRQDFQEGERHEERFVLWMGYINWSKQVCGNTISFSTWV